MLVPSQSATDIVEARSLPRARAWNGTEWICAVWILCSALMLLAYRVRQQMPEEKRGVDFVLFYAVSGLPDHLIYDPAAQIAAAEQLSPSSNGTAWGYLPYPPFVLLLIRGFRAFSYAHAYHIEQTFCIILYASGLLITLKAFLPGRIRLWAALFPLAFAYYPFMASTLLNGQISVIGFFAICIALVSVKAGREAQAGFALALCSYKPTLLIFILPILTLTKRWRVISGFLAGLAVLCGAATAVYGWNVWSDYLHLSQVFWKITTMRQNVQYVDMGAFLSILAGRIVMVQALLLCCWACIFLLLLRMSRAGVPDYAVWSIAVIFTLFVNVYVGVYDTIVVFPGLITLTTLIGIRNAGFAVLGLFAASWHTPLLVATVHFHLLSAVIISMASLFTATMLRNHWAAAAG